MCSTLLSSFNWLVSLILFRRHVLSCFLLLRTKARPLIVPLTKINVLLDECCSLASSDDEKFLFKPNLKLEDVQKFAFKMLGTSSLAVSSSKKTFIFSNLDYVGGPFYHNVVRIARCITLSQSKNTFGFQDSWVARTDKPFRHPNSSFFSFWNLVVLPPLLSLSFESETTSEKLTLFLSNQPHPFPILSLKSSDQNLTFHV